MSVLLRSFAKINWALEVGHRRADGYHEVRTVVQTIDLYDRLLLEEIDEEIEIICEDERVPCNQTNLAYKAAAALREATGIEKGVRIEIEKQIPVAAGLGGGSSNAAATLIGLQRLWNIGLPRQELFSIGERLGSDVPFFFLGGTALATGRGERVYPLDDITEPYILLVNPGIEVSTREAYAALRPMLTNQNSPCIMPFALFETEAIPVGPAQARNDLEKSVLPQYPVIAEIKQKLAEASARSVLMSGSGATVFAVFDSQSLLDRACEELREESWLVIRTRTISRSDYHSSLIT